MYKSPFLIEQNFISPYLCEDIIDLLNFSSPDRDKDNNPISSIKYNDDIELAIFDHIKNIIPNIEQYYTVQYNGTSDMRFVYLPQGIKASPAISENSIFTNGKWNRIKNNDFTGIIFLSEYNDKPPFSDEFEVYGGKLEFKQHGFGFNPNRGNLIIFPSDPHFLHTFSDVLIGNSYYIKFNIVCKEVFKYNRLQYQGNYLSWFKEIG